MNRSLVGLAALISSFVIATESYAAINPSTRLECEAVGGASAFRSNHANYAGDLMRAINSEDWPLVRGLLLLGATQPRNLSSGQMKRLQEERVSAALIPASARGNLSEVHRLLSEGADANAIAKADNYMSPLAWAARCDHPDIVKLLIMRGADVNERFGYSSGIGWNEGSTALIWASDSGAEKSVSILLSNHADVNLREEWVSAQGAAPIAGRTALYSAENPQIRKMLLDSGANPAPARR